MTSRRKPEFSMNADLENFRYEVAEEIAINNKKHRGLTGGTFAKGAGATTKNIGAAPQQQ